MRNEKRGLEYYKKFVVHLGEKYNNYYREGNGVQDMVVIHKKKDVFCNIRSDSAM